MATVDMLKHPSKALGACNNAYPSHHAHTCLEDSFVKGRNVKSAVVQGQGRHAVMAAVNLLLHCGAQQATELSTAKPVQVVDDQQLRPTCMSPCTSCHAAVLEHTEGGLTECAVRGSQRGILTECVVRESQRNSEPAPPFSLTVSN